MQQSREEMTRSLRRFPGATHAGRLASELEARLEVVAPLVVGVVDVPETEIVSRSCFVRFACPRETPDGDLVVVARTAVEMFEPAHDERPSTERFQRARACECRSRPHEHGMERGEDRRSEV